MGVAERRLREKERRRNEIIDAAEEVFFSKGIDSAKMDEVAEAAELSKGLLYFYFKSKDDLHAAIALRAIHILRQSFQAAVRTHAKGIDKVQALGRAYIDFALEYPNYCAAMAHQTSREPSNDPTSYAALCDAEGDNVLLIVAEAIRAGIQDGTVRADVDPAYTAIILWGQTHGLVQVATLQDVQERHNVVMEHIADEFLRLTRDMLKAPLS